MSEFISFVVVGIVTGSIYAVSASGLVVTYNTTGIFNFAHGAMGMVLAYVFWQFWQGWHWPVLLSLAVALLVVAPLMGAVIERLVMRPLYGASTSIRLAVTIGLLLLLVALAGTVWPQTNVYNMPQFFNGDQVSIGGVILSAEQLIAIGVAVVLALFLRLFFKHTRSGVAMRAVVDDPGLASLTGTPSGRIAAYAWMLGAMLAGLAGILIAAVNNTMDILVLTELVIYGYSAAVVGRLRSLPLTFVGAMILGIAGSLAVGYVPISIETYVTDALPMVLLFAVLLLIPEARLTVGRVARLRPPKVASLGSTAVGGAFVVLVGVVLAMVLTGTNLFTLGDALVLSLLALSLIPLTGYGGQISLCQFTFLGLGALAMHWVGGGRSPLGLLAAVGLCAAVGAVLALPAVRLRGIYLALATLAFAVLMDNVFFTSTSIMGAGGTVAIDRPDLLGLHVDGNRAFDILLAVVLALGFVFVGALRRGPFGRRLVAMNDSPAACGTVGLSLTATKLAVFALSAGIAGLAGALYGSLNSSVDAGQFQFLDSLVIFVAVILAGSSILTGAVFAGVFMALAPVIGSHLPRISNLPGLLVGVGIVLVGRNPYGVAKLYADVSERWQRRRRRGGGAPEAAPSLQPAPLGAVEAGARSVG